MSKIKLFLLVIDLTIIHTVDSNNVHYITPFPTTQCPGKSCLALSTLAANSSDYLDSNYNTALVFLEGSHTLDSELVVSNINGSLVLSTNGSGTATIVCSSEASLEFFHISLLQISCFEFIRCSIKVRLVDQLTLEDSRFHGGNDGSLVHLTDTDTSIVRSSFVSNIAGTYQSHVRVLAYLRDNHSPYPAIQSTSARVGGALIVTSSTVNISSSSFENNTAKVGGAIFSQLGSNITISNCTFINNSATGCSDDGCHGGALFINCSCTVTAHNSTFINNTAGYGGGAIALFQGTFLGSAHNVFSGNIAGRHGGAISACERSKITMYNGCYSSNRGTDGGAIYTAGYGSITVGNIYFDNNRARRSGGVIYAHSSSSITMDNSSFDSNEAGENGGVMSAYSSSNITVGKSSFEKNEAGMYGGVIYACCRSSITVGNSSFDNNEAHGNGGVMCAHSRSSITVDNSSFDNNEAHRYGGAMSAQFSSSITVGNSSFDNNVADWDGGVIHAENSSSITVSNSSFDNNKAASGYGGVIHAHSGSNITVGNSSFDNNEARRFGGVMSAQFSSSITVGDSSFDNNVAGDNGGVIYAHSSISITVGNSSFGNNKAASRHGGVMFAQFSSSITVGNSSFDNNEAGHDGGAFYGTSSSNITVDSSNFTNNVAGNNGGVMGSISGSITVGNSSFDSNKAHNGGGVAFVRTGSFTDLGNTYLNNTASNGGVIILDEGTANLVASTLLNNTAENLGGVLHVPNYVYKHHITLAQSIFHSNQAMSGGVIALLGNDSLTVTKSKFSNNNAIKGGAIYLLKQNTMFVKYSNFSHNSASSNGGVVYSEKQNILIFNSSTFNFNTAYNNGGVLCSPFQTELTVVGDNCIFIGNQGHKGGVVYASESKINVYSQSLLMANNTAVDNGGAVYLSSANITIFSLYSTIVGNVATSGGAIFAIESQFAFSDGSCQLVGNRADNGGAIYASESRLVIEVKSWTNLSGNLVMHYGGGLYMTRSELNAKGYNLYITKNQANGNGGGIHANNSSIIIDGKVHLISNEAENGGAISLERNAKLKGKSEKNDSINLISNKAKHYGGALYVDDKTNPEMCAAITAKNVPDISKTECFSKAVFLSFSDNLAGTSGTNLFGGFLDRCTVPTQSYQKNETKKVGLSSFQMSSNINEFQLDTVSSGPVRLCFCRDGQPDCDYQPEAIQVNRGKAFSLQLNAYNHISKPIGADVNIDSLGSGTIAGQFINNVCSEVVVQFNLVTPADSETLILSVMGPCDVVGVSVRNIMVDKFTCICPIGFQIFENSCDCVCDQVLQSYQKTECNPTTKSIIRRENFWISYINHTWSNLSGYVIYPHCPFDYCHTPDKSVSINLNLPNGSNSQCDSNRMGTLCGTCRPGLSVSLGSSKCIPCPAYWPGLLVTITIVFIISGIGLVAFLLALNLTVAIGTLNAIIFYANIVAANRSAFFPSGVSFASVFISWLNFDFGFDICFFDGIGTYVKTWLQLAFPAYIIILVVVIIQLSYYFSTFGRLVGKKDPVATLATLILLSYAKLLQTIITAFSFATLDYPDGSKKTLWLPDATLEYFTSKHAVLFFIAILILLAGLNFTFLLFSWQWFLWCPRKRVKWIRNQKLISFIELYLIPYTPKYRYWTGLLLLVRVSVYLVSAFNPSGDPRVTLSATTFIMSSQFLYIATFGVRMYKNRFINTMETLTYFNIIALSIFTWYTIDADTNQTVITNVSVGITFIQLTAVILYHAYKHMNQKLFTRIQESAICIKSKEKLIPKKQNKRVNNQNQVPVDEDIHQFHMLLDIIDRPANTNDYNIPQVQPKPVEPTQSVVEIPKPIQAAPGTPPPPSLEAIKEEPQLEYQQQEEESEQDGINMIPVTENLATDINKNKKCINNYPGIEILECEDTSCINPGNDIEHSLQEKSIPKHHSTSQINSYSDTKQAKEEAMEMTQSEDKGQSSQNVPPFPADSDLEDLKFNTSVCPYRNCKQN